MSFYKVKEYLHQKAECRPDQAPLPWGKFRAPNEFLSLTDHMADVAACLAALLDLPLMAARIRAITGRPLDPVTRARLCVIGFLHDAGKLSNRFQAQIFDASEGRAGHTREGWGLIADPVMRQALGLAELLSWGGAVENLLLAALAHHGRPIDTGSGVDKRCWTSWRGYDPAAAAATVGQKARALFPKAFGNGPDLPDAPAFQHLFAGLVALADQIGSREGDFPLRRIAPVRVAGDLLQALGIDASAMRGAMQERSPATLFGWPDSAEAKPMQVALADLPVSAHLVVLESETGSGKTEAAVLRFLRLFRAGEVDALYFALPSRAAASQIFERVGKAVKQAFGAEAVLAMPGYIRAGDAEGTALVRWEVSWSDDPDAEQRDARWAAETPRRFLAAPVAVGTVDQVMLAGLRVKWAHFRAAALVRSYLVVDEVHASDVYMAEVMGALVRDHVAAGGHALLMSATLGAAARAKWLGGPHAPVSRHDAYPSLSWQESGAEVHRAIAGGGGDKAVAVTAQPLIAEQGAVARVALDAARRGARVLVIRNTVPQVAALFREIEALDAAAPLLTVGPVAAPHHGRFAAEDRRRLDAAIEAAFGKGTPSRGIIAVASQTAEQSLDLDADLLITDICPIDVLLQRIGRLHRHHRDNRPTGHTEARCLVLTPEVIVPTSGLLAFGLGARGDDGSGVYPDITGIAAVQRLIGDGATWRIPTDNRRLVEAGTDRTTLDRLADELGPDWRAERGKVLGGAMAKAQIGRLNLLDRRDAFDGETEVFPDDRAILTRLGADRIEVPFASGQIGPFGTPVSRVSVPAHWGFAGLEEVTGTEWRAEGAALVLQRAEGQLVYDRLGLRLERT
jgi:CRISPR-associated endonuclease/helicase Cas3